MTPRVLVVDDEERMRSLLTLHLRQAFSVEAVASGKEALQRLDDGGVDVVVLDILMPELDGRDVCRRIRARHDVPVLMLTALAAVEEKLEAFEAGADDYLTKPFDPRELIARVDALLRRSRSVGDRSTVGQGEPQLDFPGLTLDVSTRDVRVGERSVALTPKEYELFLFLASSPGRPFTREDLLHEVWKDAAYVETRTVDSHIKTLREKLGRDRAGATLVTVWGVGYKFDPSALSR